MEEESRESEVGVPQVEHRGIAQLGSGVEGPWVEERLVQPHD